MGVETGTAILIASAITAAAAGGQAIQANQAKQEAKGQANKAADQQRKLEEDLAKQQQTAETKQAAEKAASEARRRQIVASTLGQGRQDTILTSPLGAVERGQQGGGKTLLGA